MAKLLNLQEWAAEVYTTPPSLFHSASMDAGGANLSRAGAARKGI